VERRREVVVGKDERGRRGEQRGEDPTERGDPDDGEEVDEQHAGEAQVVALRVEDEGDGWDEDHGGAQTRDATTPGQRRVRTPDHRSVGCDRGARRDHVHVDRSCAA